MRLLSEEPLVSHPAAPLESRQLRADPRKISPDGRPTEAGAIPDR